MITIEEILSGAEKHAVAFENRGLAVLEVRGKDGLDLLHRLSTADLLSGPTPRARRSILTTEKGRIVDLVHLLIADSGIRMLVSADGRKKVAGWIEKFTITEDITLVDLSAEFVAVYMLGRNMLDIARKVLGVEIAGPCVDVLHSDFGPVSFRREDYGTGSAGVFLLRRTDADGLLTSVELSGAIRLDSPLEIETLRILAGEPAYGHELAETFNPLELGLRNAVSFTKGCYVGQEVIARLDSYMKVQRELVAIDLREAPSATVEGNNLDSAGESAGILTSITDLAFADGRRRGLAVVRRSTEPRSTTVTVRWQDGSVNGHIVPMLSLGGIGEGKG